MKRDKVVALIPARGGSKSIPRKNIRRLGSHPLVAYSIAAGLQAQHVDRVIVSTDDEEIAQISRLYGAEVPFMRPVELSQDDTADLPVFLHAMAWLETEEKYAVDLFVQLRPTSPLRPQDCVDGAIQVLHSEPEADSVRGVVPSAQNPYKMWKITERGMMRPLLEEGYIEAYNMPRQALPQTYWQTGHIDVIRASTMRQKGSLTGDHVMPYLISPEYSVDIDNPSDWERAERLLEMGQLGCVLPGLERQHLPERIDLIVLDFDGVITDNRVWVNAAGDEWVAANRSDGWGIAQLKEQGHEIFVLSTETNPVVAARCQKLGLDYIQGSKDKRASLEALLQERGITAEHAVYLGNDTNDTDCFDIVGCAIVVADAHSQAKAMADIVLSRPGGFGAVRELADLILGQPRSGSA